MGDHGDGLAQEGAVAWMQWQHMVHFATAERVWLFEMKAHADTGDRGESPVLRDVLHGILHYFCPEERSGPAMGGVRGREGWRQVLADLWGEGRDSR